MTETTTDKRLRLFDRLLSVFGPGSLVDLGAGHGAFSERAVGQGWTVTAVDARTERFPDVTGIEWRQQDVREVQFDGFDLVVNLGLFYHLTLEDQLDLLDRARGIPMILDTHVAAPDTQGYDLSGMVEQRGYSGRLYPESALQHTPTASWGNDDSFWATEESLVRQLTERGWDVMVQKPYYMPSRTFFLCLVR